MNIITPKDFRNQCIGMRQNPILIGTLSVERLTLRTLRALRNNVTVTRRVNKTSGHIKVP